MRPIRPRWLGWTSFIVALLFSTVDATLALAQGELDTTFGGDGKVMTNFSSKRDFAYDVAIHPSDGKIVAAGPTGGRFAVARFNTDGTLDSTFGGGDGKVVTDFTPGADVATAVAIQGDGRIVAAGFVDGSGGRFAVARYDTDGTLDTTFGGGDGMVITNFTPGDDFAWTVAIQGDGKIVAAGGAESGDEAFALVRYNTDGTLDSTFGGDGRVVTNFTGTYDYIDAIAIQPSDDRIVAVGSTSYYGRHPRFALARYNTDGSLDTTFSGDGTATTQFTTGRSWAFATAIQADGRIVVGGQGGGSFAMARYTAGGSLDTTFSGDGKTLTNFTRGTDYADDIAVQSSDGRIVAGGSANYAGEDSAFAVGRYNTNGTLDTTFGGAGKVTTNFTPGVDLGTSLALQTTDGNIVVAGWAGTVNTQFAVARYLAA